MKIEKGMKFRGKMNGRMIEVIGVSDGVVMYKDLKYGTTFNVGREMFEKCHIEAVPLTERWESDDTGFRIITPAE